MSIRVMARVWEHSAHSGSALLMLLAIADFADDEGRAYPSVTSLAEKCRMTGRNANHVLAVLRESGELIIRQNEGPKGTNLYHVQPLKPVSPPEAGFTLKPVSSTPEAGFLKPLKPASDEPSVNHHEPSGSGKRSLITLKKYLETSRDSGLKAIREDDPIFTYAGKVGISPEMLNVAWMEFKAYWLENKKRKRDWPGTFREAVRRNRAGIWYLKEGEEARWTTVGEQARRVGE